VPYLVIYDLPRAVPRWKLRDRLGKLLQEGVMWHRLQHSVLLCPTMREAALVAEAIWLTASEVGQADDDHFHLQVLEVAREVPLREVFARAEAEREDCARCSECAYFRPSQPGGLADGFCSYRQAFVHAEPPARCPHFRPKEGGR